MEDADKMTIAARRKYIQRMWGLYRAAGKKGKGELLDEMEAVTGMHRKSLVRILNGRLSRKKRVRGLPSQIPIEGVAKRRVPIKIEV